MKKFSDDIVVLTEEQNTAVEALSESIVKMIKEGKSTDEILRGDIEEGLLGGIVGGLAGATIGPALGRAICRALGIERGILYNFLNSRAFLTAVCGYAGLKY